MRKVTLLATAFFIAFALPAYAETTVSEFKNELFQINKVILGSVREVKL